MPTVLDASLKGVSANSYIDITTATDLLTNTRLYSEAWTVATEAQKSAALIWATRLLDEGFEWFGAKRTIQQSLRWPRAGILDDDLLYVDQDTIPYRLQQATADLALELLKRDRQSDPLLLGNGFRSVSLSGINLQVDPTMILALIPRHVILAVEIWGIARGEAVGGMKEARLFRT